MSLFFPFKGVLLGEMINNMKKFVKSPTTSKKLNIYSKVSDFNVIFIYPNR